MQKRKLKSIIISSYDDIKNPYYAGGGAFAIHELARRLSVTYRITVITGSYPGSKNSVRDGVYYERIGLPFVGAKFGQLAYQIALPWQVKTKKYDVWMESFTPPFSTNCLQLFTKKPVIGIVHMLSGEDMRRKYKLPFDKSEKIGLRTYKHLVVLSEHMKKKILKINRNAHIAVIPNGIEIIKKHTTPAQDKKSLKHILYLGRIEVNQKGLDLLLDSYAQNIMKMKYPLAIAGSGEKKELDKLQKLIRTHNLTKHVKLYGRVEGAKKEELFNSAVCVVVPSRFETFSLVALEALSHGLPIITFNIEGLSWIPSGVAVKVEAFNTKALSQALVRIVKSSNTSFLKNQKGMEYAKKLTWDSIAKLYERYIPKVYNQK